MSNEKGKACPGPLASVSMIAYNAETYIADALESVLRQKTDFPFEIVIGEDCSTDITRSICEAYTQKYPQIIRLLPSETNHGITGNAARTLKECKGKYIAICDGDDLWTDPNKLQNQVGFLEKNPGYGFVFTDINLIDENNQAIRDDPHLELRAAYASGGIFFKLLKTNFINISTAVFRSSFLDGYVIDTHRSSIYDYPLWLHIAMQSKGQYLDKKTASYRKHTGGATSSAENLRKYRKRFQFNLFETLLAFDKLNTSHINSADKAVLFRKLLSLAARNYGTLEMRLQILRLLPKYFPGFQQLLDILASKTRHRLPLFTPQPFVSPNQN